MAHGIRKFCRHCEMVEFYRLTRDSEVRFAESLANGDEDFRPVVFKEWLTRFEWEREAA